VGWELGTEVEAFAAAAGGLLAADPAVHTLPLTVIEQLRLDPDTYQDALFAWFDDGTAVRGAAIVTPPHPLVLAVVPDRTLAALVAALRARGAPLPGVSGRPDLVGSFLAAWGGEAPPPVDVAMRLYDLEAVIAPPVPAGAGRLATEADTAAMVAMAYGFFREMGEDARPERGVRRQIADRRMWLWAAPDGEPAAFASRNLPAAGIARIGPVYTAPGHRGRGYGTAVTAACTADALARGAARAVLYADLGNPTSNRIYQRIGYRPVTDHRMVRFA
jgi:predicted GNAT family acetyltransferase